MVENVLEVINQIVIIPVVFMTFFLLMYMVVYLKKKDPDVIRARIFLRYGEFKKSFLLLAAFAFLLVLHVSLIYFPGILGVEYIENDNLIEDIQKFFGVTLALTLSAFVYFIFRSIK